MSALAVELEAPAREGYASTCLGKAVWIRHDFRNVPMKAREECAPFTYTLAEGSSIDAAAQAKFVAGLAKLERATARAAKARAPKAVPAAKVATVRMQAGRVLEVAGLPRGYTFQVEEVV